MRYCLLTHADLYNHYKAYRLLITCRVMNSFNNQQADVVSNTTQLRASFRETVSACFTTDICFKTGKTSVSEEHLQFLMLYVYRLK